MAPILTIIGPKKSRRRDLFFDSKFGKKCGVAINGSVDGSIAIERSIDRPIADRLTKLSLLLRKPVKWISNFVL